MFVYSLTWQLKIITTRIYIFLYFISVHNQSTLKFIFAVLPLVLPWSTLQYHSDRSY